MHKISNISCVIIAKDAAHTLGTLLDSLTYFDEVLVYVNNSTDSTDSIARSYSNVNLVYGDFIGFGPTKNKAALTTKHDWILSLDADEVVSPALIKELNTIHLDDTAVYMIKRENYYKQRHIKHCWGNDNILRLYNKTKTSFNNNYVHENIRDTDLHIKQLSGSIRHYPYSTITDFIIKSDRYSTLFAEEYAGKKSASPLQAFLNAHFSFLKTYIFKRGFLDGYAGLIIAFSHMVTNFYKYMKLYEKNLEKL